MGEALLRGVIRAGLLPAAAVVVVEPVKERREKLAKELSIAAVEDIRRTPAARRYVLAVKPQQMESAAASLREVMGESALVISIAAGISTAYLAKALGSGARIIRAMPNTPMLVGAGCTCLCAGPGATRDDLEFAQKLFAAGGLVRVVDEPAMDAVTAISGSGPAYFFYLIEAMIEAGVAEGLSPDTAAVLAHQTCAGAAALLAQSDQPASALRAKVTSPGGTTQAAIETLDRANIREALIRAVRAAAARSRQLGK
jgi:pyrroline-5-carboxylate reductase